MKYINSTGLRKYLKNPEAYKHYTLAGEDETPAKVFGAFYHTSVLEPAKIRAEYALEDQRPELDKGMTSKLNKEWKAGLKKTLVSKSVATTVVGMKKKLTANPNLAGLIDKGMNEESYYVDDFKGIKVKVRPDKITKTAIMDLKTTTDASTDGFTRTIFKYGYHIQAALYLDVLKLFDPADRQFVFVAQEKDEPYSYQIFRLSNEVIEYGRYQYEELIELHKKCVRENKWGGYEIFNEQSEYGVQEIVLPHWIN